MRKKTAKGTRKMKNKKKPRMRRTPSMSFWFVSLSVPHSLGVLTKTSQNAVADLPDSILAHRILVDIYLREEDFQNTIATAEKGLVLVRRLEADMGEQLLQYDLILNHRTKTHVHSLHTEFGKLSTLPLQPRWYISFRQNTTPVQFVFSTMY